MKASLLISLTFCFISTAFGQEMPSAAKEQESMKLFCHQWVLSTMATQGKSITVPANEAMYLTFKADRRYTDSSARFSVSHGTWLYDSKTQLLYMDGKGDKSKTKIIRVTPSELVMEMEYPSVTMTATYKRVE